MLSHHVSNSILSLSEFNSRLLNFDYGYSESDKPIPILSTTLSDPNKSFRCSSSQMLLLVCILPLLIGDKIKADGDKHWSCFLLLQKIIDIVFSPLICHNLCSSLKLLIKEHHSLFVQLYGKHKYIPKLHFLLHYPETK